MEDCDRNDVTINLRTVSFLGVRMEEAKRRDGNHSAYKRKKMHLVNDVARTGAQAIGAGTDTRKQATVPSHHAEQHKVERDECKMI